VRRQKKNSSTVMFTERTATITERVAWLWPL
jgi:hypothetical protein